VRSRAKTKTLLWRKGTLSILKRGTEATPVEEGAGIRSVPSKGFYFLFAIKTIC
jgi:hypothetical protein